MDTIKIVLYGILLGTIATFSWILSGKFFSQLDHIDIPELIGTLCSILLSLLFICLILKVFSWFVIPNRMPNGLEKFLLKHFPNL